MRHCVLVHNARRSDRARVLTIMFAYKLPLTLSAALLGAYAMPLSTNQVLLVGQALFGICVCFALFLLLLHAAGQQGDGRDEEPDTGAHGSRAPRARPGQQR